MEYISCFSGIGGFEGSEPPILFCELDPECRAVLSHLHPGSALWDDVTTLEPPKVDLVVGGWPCQDISVAGKQAGLSGLKSRLLLDMLRVASEAGASTIAAENVSNLLRMRNGLEFRATLDAFHSAGFRYVAWRLLNARSFGLPQHRQRLILVASKDKAISQSLFRDLPILSSEAVALDEAAGFYWTAGTHSINYSKGYLPTIKIGSTLGIASPPAVHYGDIVRQLSATEALRLQGFDIPASQFRSQSSAFRMAGNAVARPIGRWVIDGLGITLESPILFEPPQPTLFDIENAPEKFPDAGFSEQGVWMQVKLKHYPLAKNLSDYLDLESPSRLSIRAASGLLRRVNQSGQQIPPALKHALETIVEGKNDAGK